MIRPPGAPGRSSASNQIRRNSDANDKAELALCRCVNGIQTGNACYSALFERRSPATGTFRRTFPVVAWAPGSSVRAGGVFCVEQVCRGGEAFARGIDQEGSSRFGFEGAGSLAVGGPERVQEH